MIKDTNTFWSWFAQHERKYRNIQRHDGDKTKRLLTEIVSRLEAYTPGLSVEVGIYGDLYELVITAQGVAALFADAEWLVMHAPPLKNWRILALKPARGMQFDFRMGDIVLSPHTLSFRPLASEKDGDRIGICILYGGSSTDDEEHRQALINGIYYCLDVVLGELSATLDVELIEFAVRAREPGDTGMLPLSELSAYISWRKKERRAYKVRYPEHEKTLLQGGSPEKPVFVIVNRNYRYYDYMADYPYLLSCTLAFDRPMTNGLPAESMDKVYEAEDIIKKILGEQGHHVASRTRDGHRTIYCYVGTRTYAQHCAQQIEQAVTTYAIRTDTTFDKYWIAVRSFMHA